MNARASTWTVVGCILAANAAIAQVLGPPAATPPPVPAPAFVQGQPKPDKDKPIPPPVDPTPPAALRAEAPTGLNPHMIGDFLGGYRNVTFSMATFGTLTVTTTQRGGQVGPPFTTTQTTTVPVTTQYTVLIPAAARGSFKIGENESPFPQCRFFAFYDYFNGVRGPNSGLAQPTVTTQTINTPFSTTTTQLVIPGFAPAPLGIHRETIGFERAFWDHRASIGMRVPLLQVDGPAPFNDQMLGDITVIFKYAPWLNRETGNVVSTGLAVTVPTGPGIETTAGTVNATLLQPFVGYGLNWDNLFVYGFSSIVLPTDNRDVTMLFNDLGVGYRLYQNNDRFVSALVPMLEAHVTTPLNHRNVTDPIVGLDLVALTAGVHIGLGNSSLLTLAVATPVSGPQLFNFETIVQFNFFY